MNSVPLSTSAQPGCGEGSELGLLSSYTERNQCLKSMSKVPECSVCYPFGTYAFGWGSSHHDKEKEASLRGSERIRMGQREAENSESWPDPLTPQGQCPLPTVYSTSSAALGRKHGSLTTSTSSYTEALMLGWGSRALFRRASWRRRLLIWAPKDE